MAASLSCKSKTPKDFPKIEIPTMKQPIVEHKFCDKKGENCAVKSMCKEWRLNEKEEWILIANHPLKYCHGIFGVTAPELNIIQKFIREVKLWLKANIKVKNAETI